MNVNDRRYTLQSTDVLCRQIAGVSAWDVDVAAELDSHLTSAWWCATEAEFTEEARRAGCRGVNGLRREAAWEGRVWCNPPWSQLSAWVERAWSATTKREADIIALLAPANRTEQPWWQEYVEPYRDSNHGQCPTTPALRLTTPALRLTTHHLPGRIRYGQPTDPRGDAAGSPPFGSVLLVWRN